MQRWSTLRSDHAIWKRTLKQGWWYLPVIHLGYPLLVPWPRRAQRAAVPRSVRWAGFGLALGGGALTTWSIATLIHEGQGTPAPHDPPRQFVCAGPYCHCRNPMELGNILTMVGRTIARGCPRHAIASLLFLASIHGWVVLVEEPYLQRHFGSAYRRYRRNVPRWGWRWHAWRSTRFDDHHVAA